ncbi:hypothetical protein I6H08_37675 (plasmid) [Burkholderia gladioli]|nr:hypothetical protein [Burkholderia gladioli]QPQ88816.1 hypothetical protein I6H08_37675 [Burkholderia gladioli]
MKKTALATPHPPESRISFKGHRFPSEVISYAVWLIESTPAPQALAA